MPLRNVSSIFSFTDSKKVCKERESDRPPKYHRYFYLYSQSFEIMEKWGCLPSISNSQ